MKCQTDCPVCQLKDQLHSADGCHVIYLHSPCDQPVNPDRRIGHPTILISNPPLVVFVGWFVFYCISILSTWWHPEWLCFSIFFPPMLFLWWSPVFAVSNVMNRKKISEMEPPPGDSTALHWSLTLPVHSVLLLNSFMMSDIQNWLNCIFRKQLSTCQLQNLSSYKEFQEANSNCSQHGSELTKQKSSMKLLDTLLAVLLDKDNAAFRAFLLTAQPHSDNCTALRASLVVGQTRW